MNQPIGTYLTLGDFCHCTETYARYQDKIDAYPIEEESIKALKELAVHVLDPVILHFGLEHFVLTYGFCSKELKRHLERDPITKKRNGRIDPGGDQHMAMERKRSGLPYCRRPGAACDFHIEGYKSDAVVQWIVEAGLPFDRLYYYGAERPIHISYGPLHSRFICTFNATGQPTGKGVEHWRELLPTTET